MYAYCIDRPILVKDGIKSSLLFVEDGMARAVQLPEDGKKWHKKFISCI